MRTPEMILLLRVEGLPGLSGKLEFEERHRAEQLSELDTHNLAWTLVERERQLATALAELEKGTNAKV
ncbi:MAG TPA: hypothetical protein VFE27_24235 [Acidobacteriaceae bacterium]|jgi:hypothetical protein|nr:hypothetical protein [Acidobacteriaceae bacterium]